METLNEPLPQGTGSGSGPKCKVTILGGAEAQTRFEAASKQSNDPPLSRVNILESGEDNMKLKELMELYIMVCLPVSTFYSWDLIEEVYVEALHVKYPIIDWEVYYEDTRRDDLVKLWDLVKERFSTTEPIDDKEKELWVELKRLFEPDNDDTLWKLQRSVSQRKDGVTIKTTQTVSALKLPVLKTREYDIWSMRMEQYLTFTDHALWEVIVNGDSVSPVASASIGAEAILNEHLLKFYACKDAKSLWEVIKNSQEGLDKTYDRFQKLISQLEIHGEVISQEDANLKLLRSLPSAWNNIDLIMRNKSNIDTLSMDDLYNNLKDYEFEIKGKSISSSNSQNVAFVSFDNSSSTNETVNTTHSVSASSSKDQASIASYVDDIMFSFFSIQSNAPQLDW
ncbi:hypothetical protein Tco_1142439 [Tanacetum coccineum]